jgi:hypothetical protein
MCTREPKVNEKSPNKNNDESLILEKIIDETLEVLNEISKKRTQINFDSEEARRQIAKEIVDKSERKNAK